MRSLTYRWPRRGWSRHSFPILPASEAIRSTDRPQPRFSALRHFYVNSLLRDIMTKRLKRELSFGYQAHQWEDSMRILMYFAAGAATLTTVLTVPAQAAHNRVHFHTHPYWQGEPTDRLPIWRYGYYQGNDPDQFIRSQMMRDPVYGPLH